MGCTNCKWQIRGIIKPLTQKALQELKTKVIQLKNDGVLRTTSILIIIKGQAVGKEQEENAIQQFEELLRTLVTSSDIQGYVLSAGMTDFMSHGGDMK